MNRQSASAETIPSPQVPVRPKWIASRQEAVVEPGRELVHTHPLWDQPETSGRYLAPALLEDITGFEGRATRAGYGWAWDASKRLTSACSKADKRALFADTVCNVYSLARKAA
jgi:hypothetical protein